MSNSRLVRIRRRTAAVVVMLLLFGGVATPAHADGLSDPRASPVVGTTTVTTRFIDENGWPVPGLVATVSGYKATWDAATATWQADRTTTTFRSDAKGVLRVKVPVFEDTRYENSWLFTIDPMVRLRDSSYVFDVPDHPDISAAPARTVNHGTVRLRAVKNNKPYTKRIKTSSKSAVRAAYRTRYAAKVKYEKEPKVKKCTVAATSKATQNRTRDAVNYMRAMSGLSPVKFTSKLSKRASKAAVVQHSLGYLTHYPYKPKCKDKTGIRASNQSNLSDGKVGAANIAQYMEDAGADNVSVGHRRWILDPEQTHMGVGYAGSYGALFIMAPGKTSNPNPLVTGWPTAGYFPAELEPSGRWSVTFNRPDLDFSKAKVSVSAGGKTKKAKIIYRDKSQYRTGAKMIMGNRWGLTFTTPASTRKVSGSKTRTVTVKVSGITVRGKYKVPTVTYKVKLFKAAKSR